MSVRSGCRESNDGRYFSPNRHCAPAHEEAREGWELVGSVLNRDQVQTVGGALTTRESTSFIAYRRPRK